MAIEWFTQPSMRYVHLTLGRQANSYPHRDTRGKGWTEPLPGYVDMFQYFETILPLVESL